MRALFPDAESATMYRDACNVADVREEAGAWPIPVHPDVPVPEGVAVEEKKPF